MARVRAGDCRARKSAKARWALLAGILLLGLYLVLRDLFR